MFRIIYNNIFYLRQIKYNNNAQIVSLPFCLMAYWNHYLTEILHCDTTLVLHYNLVWYEEYLNKWTKTYYVNTQSFFFPLLYIIFCIPLLSNSSYSVLLFKVQSNFQTGLIWWLTLELGLVMLYQVDNVSICRIHWFGACFIKPLTHREDNNSTRFLTWAV